MTPEEKQLLLKDLCARLPYGVKVNFRSNIEVLCEVHIYQSVQTVVGKSGILYDVDMPNVKPYLRPISSMTEEEAKQLNSILPCSMSFSYTTKGELIIYTDSEYDGDHFFGCFVDIEDWLNAHYFDFRGLIPMGLALEAKEGMYKTE